jgi:hypothetical protein
MRLHLFPLQLTLTPPLGTVSQLSIKHWLLFCHSGLAPESSSFSTPYTTGCPRTAVLDKLIKSGMTGEG